MAAAGEKGYRLVTWKAVSVNHAQTRFSFRVREGPCRSPSSISLLAKATARASNDRRLKGDKCFHQLSRQGNRMLGGEAILGQ